MSASKLRGEAVSGDRPEREDAAADLDAALGEEELADRPRGDARRRLPRRGALEHVAQVRGAVLHSAGEIRVARPRPRESLAGGRRGIDRERPHDGLPVRVVAVRDPDRDRGAECHAARGRRPRRAPRPSRSSCGRRARSRAGGGRARRPRRPGRSTSPDGIPSRIAVSRGPCDSPAVERRSSTPRV